MGIFARFFGDKQQTVDWLNHPYTKGLTKHFAYLLWEAKNLKRNRERVGRSADYWQGRIDLCEELMRDASRIGWPYTSNAVKCFRGWCPICHAAAEQECDKEKHGK